MGSPWLRSAYCPVGSFSTKGLQILWPHAFGSLPAMSQPGLQQRVRAVKKKRVYKKATCRLSEIDTRLSDGVLSRRYDDLRRFSSAILLPLYARQPGRMSPGTPSRVHQSFKTFCRERSLFPSRAYRVYRCTEGSGCCKVSELCNPFAYRGRPVAADIASYLWTFLHTCVHII